jgi:hypothetical protein
MQTLLLLIQSPQVEVLGITVVSGGQCRDEEVAHTLCLLEVIGRTDIPSGALLYFSARDCLKTEAVRRANLYAASSRNKRRSTTLICSRGRSVESALLA